MKDEQLIFSSALFEDLLAQAAQSDRRRVSLDLRTSAADGSQRMLNALQPGTQVPIHRHRATSETVVCLQGKMDEVFFEEVKAVDGQIVLRETKRVRLCPDEGQMGCQVPQGMWHTVEVLAPTVILEAKDGAYIPPAPADIRPV